MNPAGELINELRRRGATLTPNGDKLRITAPRGVITPQLRDQIAQHKPALMRLLRDAPGDVDDGSFPPLEEPPAFGQVWSGYAPAAWVVELRHKAERCDMYRRDMACHFRAWAADIERRLGKAAS